MVLISDHRLRKIDYRFFKHGIRLPKPLLEQIGIRDDVDLEVENKQIIIRPLSNPRDGWDIAFKSMAGRGDDSIRTDLENISNSWDEAEWQW